MVLETGDGTAGSRRTSRLPRDLHRQRRPAHLLSPEVSLETYVLDILNLIRYNDLSDVVLAAHSMGGAPAVMVLDRIPDSIRHVVFVDSLLPVDGESALDLVPPEEAAAAGRWSSRATA